MKFTSIKQIIKIIRERRAELGYTQSYIAGRLDMSQNGYSNLESGLNALSADRLLSICKELSLSPAQLMIGKNQRQVDFDKLFYKSENPMWMFDPKTLRFIEVNDAAVRNYGYTKRDFMTMTIADIRPKEDSTFLQRCLDNLNGDITYEQPIRHLDRKGRIRHVKVTCYQVENDGAENYLVIPQAFVENKTQQHFMETMSELQILSAQLDSAISQEKRKDIVQRMQVLISRVVLSS